MRSSCKQPPGVVGPARWLEFNFPVNGVLGCDNWDWAAIILGKKVRSPTRSFGLINNVYNSLFALLSPTMVMPGYVAEAQPKAGHHHN